jgi:hypothetical protein
MATVDAASALPASWTPFVALAIGHAVSMRRWARQGNCCHLAGGGVMCKKR